MYINKNNPIIADENCPHYKKLYNKLKNVEERKIGKSQNFMK